MLLSIVIVPNFYLIFCLALEITRLPGFKWLRQLPTMPQTSKIMQILISLLRAIFSCWWKIWFDRILSLFQNIYRYIGTSAPLNERLVVRTFLRTNATVTAKLSLGTNPFHRTNHAPDHTNTEESENTNLFCFILLFFKVINVDSGLQL